MALPRNGVKERWVSHEAVCLQLCHGLCQEGGCMGAASFGSSHSLEKASRDSEAGRGRSGKEQQQGKDRSCFTSASQSARSCATQSSCA